MGADGDLIGKLALGGQVARDVTIIRSVIRQIGLAILRVEHNDLLAQFVADQIERSNEVGISADEHKRIMLRPRLLRTGAPLRVG